VTEVGTEQKTEIIILTATRETENDSGSLVVLTRVLGDKSCLADYLQTISPQSS